VGIAQADEPKFLRIAFQRFWDMFEPDRIDPALEDSGVIWGIMREANNAIRPAREQWAQAGLIFAGCHYEGGSYPAREFCAISRVLYECPAIGGDETTPAVAFDLKSSSIDRESLKTAEAYGAALKRVHAYFEAMKGVGLIQ
jgi:hypothetical protein